MEALSSREKRKILLLLRNNVMCCYLLYRKLYRPKRKWSRPLFLKRPIPGQQDSLVTTLRQSPQLFFDYTRMSGEQFDYLLSLVGDRLEKQTTKLRCPIPASDRLAICLRFLSSGVSYTEISHAFRVGRSTICGIVRETCKVLGDVLGPLVLSAPSSPDEWAAVAEGFSTKWDFPNCIGSVDGKYISVQPQLSAGSSVILLVVCDANYTFVYVDVGRASKFGEGGAFADSSLGKKLTEDAEFLPDPGPLPNSAKVLPFVLVGSESFPLRENLLRPYPKKCQQKKNLVFNNRLSRARRCSENALGVLSARWRVIHSEMMLKPENATLVTLACCSLHNYLVKDELCRAERRVYCPRDFADHLLQTGELVEGAWRRDDGNLTTVGRQGSNNSSRTATAIRNEFCEYFMAEGAVSWQYDSD